MPEPPPPGERLDSWKAIADYLRRDAGTARRWEKELGLPVRRLPGGRGRSVFAYTAEIDAWLATAPSANAPDARPPVASKRWLRWAAPAAIVVILGLGAWRLRGFTVNPADLRVDVTEKEVVVSHIDGTTRWRYSFPSAYRIGLPFSAPAARIVGGRDPGVYVATENQIRLADREEMGGELSWFDLDGRLRRSFSLTDDVVFNGTKYARPWAIEHFSVDESGPARRIAMAGHHHVWSASFVTILDEQWRRRGTFWHHGWIEAVHWVAPDRLLVAGYSNVHGGGMVALLDAANLDGQGPEPAGTEGHCDSCGTGQPLRMVVMPRTEMNRLTASRFNRAVLQVAPDRILARTYEVWSANDVADALYEFTPQLELVNASFSERYWEYHQALERQGVITHTREHCPDKDGPREVQVWSRESGWRTQQLR